jgi:hypothetical protein
MRYIRPFLLLALLAAPNLAAADYLYTAFQDANKPYVMMIVDSSGSMSSTDETMTSCPYGGSPGACKSRADAVRDAFIEMVGKLDGAGVGLEHFADTPLASCSNKGCGITWVASPDGTSRDSTRDQRAVIVDALVNLPRVGYSPVGMALTDVKNRLATIAANDPYYNCRKYYVILLADDGDTCCGTPETVATALRSVPVAKAWDDALIVWAQNGEPLRPEQGYPLRLLLPGWEGNINVKWLRRIELAPTRG